MNTLLTGNDDDIALSQPLGDLDPARAADTHLDLYALRNFAVLFRAVHHLDDKHAGALRDDRFFGHHQRARAFAKDGGDAGKHTRSQAQTAVVDAGAHAHRAAVGIDQRVDGLHQRHELAPRQGVEVHIGALALANLRQEALGQPEVDEHRVDILDIDDVSAVLQVIARVHAANARHAVKGGHDLQSGRRGL